MKSIGMNPDDLNQNHHSPHTPAEQPVLQATPMHDLSDFAVDSQADSAMDSPNLNSGLSQIASWPFKKIFSGLEWCFGVVTMISLLTICAAIPILQFITLGYFLEISSRIVREKKVRAGFVGIRQAARIGGWALGTLMVWGPAFNLAGIFNDAQILLTESKQLQPFNVSLGFIVLLTIPYTLWAWFRGARLRHFIWPAPVRFFRTILKRETYRLAVTGFWEFMSTLHLRELFLLGFFGFLGAAAWLLLPVLLCIGGTQLPESLRGISSLIGLPLLAITLIYLPVLQTRFSVERRLRVFWELKETRVIFKRAPIALWISMFAVWAFALPVYLAKIQLTPREVFLLPTVVFVVFAWPSRMLMGWAFSRARSRTANRNVISIWLARLAIIPVVFLYAGVVFLSRYTSWYGDWSLFEQHALLIPIPLLGG